MLFLEVIQAGGSIRAFGDYRLNLNASGGLSAGANVVISGQAVTLAAGNEVIIHSWDRHSRDGQIAYTYTVA